MWLRYWGKIVSDYSAMRWPCDSWFHIPMNSERNKIKSDLNSFGWTSWTQQSTASTSYLKMPLAWYRNYSSSNLMAQGTEWRYWACERYNSTNGRAVRVKSDAFSVSYYNISNWYSIRPFRDTPVIPDSSWTVEHQWTGTAWIYSNATLWLISISSDGINWTTMADKNLWATQQYSILDPLSETNCGKYYQRWNIYWFAWTWTVQNTNTQVDASNYWPWNYFSSDIFIKSSWEIGNNANLRWWTTWVQQWPALITKRYYGWKLIYDYSAIQWPCDEWFHIPMKSELVSLVGFVSSLWIDTSNWIWLRNYLKMPFSWGRQDGTSLIAQWTQWLYWESDTTSYAANCLIIWDGGLAPWSNYYRYYWYSIRPFKDKPVIPDNSWTKLYSWTWDAGIYHNSTLWLISISGDWSNWITIADKNLWATTVYNNWDTLSETNCGKYYQRWNNYWFAWTWTVPSATWGIDVSNYWPWNYYSGSTFLLYNNSNYDWALPSNDNLRWWVTGVQQRPAEVIKVYYWNRQIRPVVPVPRAEYTDWDGDVVDYVTQAFLDAGDELKGAIEIMFGWDFEQSIETDTWIDLSDWEFSPIMPFYPITTSWYGLQISNWWDMIDKHLVPEVPWYTQSICIIRDNDNLDDVEYIVWTYDSSDDWFDYQLSSLASNFSGKDTVCMFIFSM